jgi:hypothetical protein
MLGYKPHQNPYECLAHHNQLKDTVPKEYHNDLSCAYDWIKTQNFRMAMDHNSVEAWKWLSTSMINPPIKLIEKYSNEANERVSIEPQVMPLVPVKAPCCRLCNEPLAKTIYEKVKFSVILCKCDKQWCHPKCADAHVLQSGQCSLCKEYFILSPYCSTLRSTIVLM